MPEKFGYMKVEVSKNLFLAIFIMVGIGLTLCGKTEAAGVIDKKYLSQNTIDSMVSKGVYLMMASESDAGLGNRQQQAVESAKTIARNLRIIARTDPNSKYILWRVGELETEILLQEHGLRMENMNKKQKEINQLVLLFNTETARKRPDLRILSDIAKKINMLDVNKGNELTAMVVKRGADLTREIVGFLELYIKEVRLSKAQEEIDYCETQQAFMPLSQTKYASLSNQFKSTLTAKDERLIAKKSIERATSARAALAFAEAEGALASAEKSISRFLLAGESSTELTALSSLCKSERAKLILAEDSVVGATLVVLTNGGLLAASEFLKNTIVPLGLPRDKIAQIDNAMLAKAIEMKRVAESNEGNKDVVAFVPVEVDGGAFLNDLMGSAKGKAQQKTDSLRMVAIVAELASLKKNNSNLPRIEYNSKERELNIELASLNASRIYLLLDKKKVRDATDLFTKCKKDFQKYMCKEAYDMVVSAIAQPQ